MPISEKYRAFMAEARDIVAAYIFEKFDSIIVQTMSLADMEDAIILAAKNIAAHR
jgi:hypothetical protein